jgi:hypothetical protein
MGAVAGRVLRRVMRASGEWVVSIWSARAMASGEGELGGWVGVVGVEGVVMGAGEEVSTKGEAGVVGWVVSILMLVGC